MRLALVLLCLVLSSPASAQTVEDQIRTEVRRYVDAINSGDLNAVAALYLDTAAATSVGGPARAREAARGLWAMGGFDCRPVDHRRGRCD